MATLKSLQLAWGGSSALGANTASTVSQQRGGGLTTAWAEHLPRLGCCSSQSPCLLQNPGLGTARARHPGILCG